ncbi:MAG TPA: tRNA guanosine(34) transglycosylase Tgt [Acidimicrobiales bacterium]|nr:tRNA guanosine(34) transglycosylase Tgt [Acidimicrobiales bacterium]
MTLTPLTVQATDGPARAGVVTTAKGTFQTPCFMPVGTRAAVRTLTSADLEAVGAEVVLANTYHLMLRPGTDVVAAMGGLAAFMGWRGHTLTDSGGFQVFSLAPTVDDDGVTFRSTYDGSSHRLTPESAVRAQEEIGADIQMVLDVCPPLPSPPEVLRLAVDRTEQWAARARAAHTRRNQALFGIVQGGIDPDLRNDAARRTVAIGFDGYGIGGLSVGEDRPDMLAALDATIGELPADRPRYLMGVGDPVGIVEAVARGIDMFDCVLPTRLARHGTALTSTGRLQIRNAQFARDDRPLDDTCACPTCGRWARGYLRHLFQVGEPAGGRLVTVHNLSWLLGLVARTRAAVVAGDLAQLRHDVAVIWNRTLTN